MLYNLAWLNENESFPPLKEIERLNRYIENQSLFDSEHFAIGKAKRNVYEKCAERISRVIGNFEDVISFPVLLNYQRLMSLKMADLICGEYPTITGENDESIEKIQAARSESDFDQQLYATVIDISRYGDAVWRAYKKPDGTTIFTIWSPLEWFPIVSQDGTNNIIAHVLAWIVNTTQTPENLPPNYELHTQIHWTEWADQKRQGKVGTYEAQKWQLNGDGSSIIHKISSETVPTGFSTCAVFHLRAFAVSNTVYGYDDYTPIDSILSEIMTRIGQISVILDKHADPNITGPVSMVQQNPETGEYYLKMGKFWATSPGENEPKYLTWDGQLGAAFNELEFLINQLYILSELGAALIGATDSVGGAISGTAMRFKLVNPLAKARRTANALTLGVRKLFGLMSGVDYKNISVFWEDGLPDDPRENIENAILASGANAVMPLKNTIMEYFGRSANEADEWIKALDEQRQKQLEEQTELAVATDTGVNHPGPGGKVNTAAKGSTTGVNQFHGSRQSGKGQQNNSGQKKSEGSKK